MWCDTAPVSDVPNVLLTIGANRWVYYVKNIAWVQEGVISDTAQDITSTLYSTNQPLYLIIWVWQTEVPPQLSVGCYGATCCLWKYNL